MDFKRSTQTCGLRGPPAPISRPCVIVEHLSVKVFILDKGSYAKECLQAILDSKQVKDLVSGAFPVGKLEALGYGLACTNNPLYKLTWPLGS